MFGGKDNLDHETILSMFERVPKLGIDTPAGRAHLEKTEKNFAEWLEREDDHLLGPMRSLAAKHQGVRTLMREMDSRLSDMAGRALAFFDRCAHGDRRALSEPEFGPFLNQMKETLRWKEKMLF